MKRHAADEVFANIVGWGLCLIVFTVAAMILSMLVAAWWRFVMVGWLLR